MLRRNPPEEQLIELRKAPEKHIPLGHYCYCNPTWRPGTDIIDIDICPFWDSDDTKPEHETGYCHYLKIADWDEPGLGLLWDQCKECGINDDIQ
jgi:hypothetical protein